jgi:hypothetical protein
MALVDYDFYKNEYGGGAVAEESFPGCQRRAEMFLDRVTFGRIEPSNEVYGQWISGKFYEFSESELKMLKNGLCALSETVYKLNKAEEQALSGNADSGNAKSRSSGGESISYESQTTVYDEALKDDSKKNALYRRSLMEWIVPEAFRFNPFFAGSR